MMISFRSLLTLALIGLLILPCSVSANEHQKVHYTELLDLGIFSDGPHSLNDECNKNLDALLMDNPPKKYSIVTLDTSFVYKNIWETTAIINDTPITIQFEPTTRPLPPTQYYMFDEYKIYTISNDDQEKTHIGYAGIITNLENFDMSLWAYFTINNKTIWLDNINQPTKKPYLGLLTEY